MRDSFDSSVVIHIHCVTGYSDTKMEESLDGSVVTHLHFSMKLPRMN
jgi:hypothetical protein